MLQKKLFLHISFVPPSSPPHVSLEFTYSVWREVLPPAVQKKRLFPVNPLLSSKCPTSYRQSWWVETKTSTSHSFYIKGMGEIRIPTPGILFLVELFHFCVFTWIIFNIHCTFGSIPFLLGFFINLDTQKIPSKLLLTYLHLFILSGKPDSIKTII